MIPLTRPAFGPEEQEAVRMVLESGWVAQGPEVTAFEREFALVVGTPHAVAVSSCTTALHLAVLAGGVGPGDEVVLPAFTFPATANAVLYAGGTPVLVDVSPDTLNADPALVESAITPRTRAVIGVHLFGLPCDIASLRRICDARGLFLIEDAACAIGSETEGAQVGSFGDVACFSLHARKVVTAGEGGMLTTKSESLASLLESLRTHGADRGAERREQEGPAPAAARYVRLGYNYRLSDVQAAIGRVQLGRLPAFVQERVELARIYDAGLAGLPGLRLPAHPDRGVHSYQSYVVVLEPGAPIGARELRAALAERGIATRPGSHAVHTEPYLAEILTSSPSLPESEHAARASIALPLFNGLTHGEASKVVGAVRDAFPGAWRGPG